MIKYLPLLILLIPLFLQAESKYKNRTCKIYLRHKERGKIEYAYNDLKRLLTEKGYQLIDYSEPPQFKMGKKRDYLRVNIKKLGGFFPPCKVRLTLQRTKSVFTNDADKISWTKDALRSLPRTTLYGNIRCQYAIKDAISNLPKCR